MIDLTDKQSIYDAIRSADAKELWALVSTVYTLNRAKDKLQDQLDNIQVENSGAESRPSLSDDASDSEVRVRARAVLLDKLNDGSITAAEFAQFKDVFGLASAESDLNITVTSYADLCPDCPITRKPTPIDPNE